MTKQWQPQENGWWKMVDGNWEVWANQFVWTIASDAHKDVIASRFCCSSLEESKQMSESVLEKLKKGFGP
jgi:hypothetical protein